MANIEEARSLGPFRTSLEKVPLFCGLIVLAAVLAYFNSFSGVFVFDDQYSIIENRTIRTLWPLWSPFWPEMQTGVPVDGRPLVNFSFALNYALGGLNVWGYHAVNLAIHTACSLLLFGIIRRTLSSASLQEQFGRDASLLALLVTLLWALHPLQTESVTYLSQRAESLAAFFYLGTIYTSIRAMSGSRSTLWMVTSVVSCLSGMAAKETMVSAPLMVLLYDRAFVAGSFRTALRQRWPFYISLASTWLLLAWLMFLSGNRGGTAGFGVETSSWHYLLTQCKAVVHYLRLAFWPHPLVFDYGDSLITDPWLVWSQASFLVLLGIGTLFALWRHPAVGFLACWFFALLAPSSSFVPVTTQTMAEHRIYLALASPLALAVLGTYLLWGWRNLAAFLSFGASLALGFGLLTALRNSDYRNSETLWNDTLSKYARNPRAYNNYGISLIMEKRFVEAKSVLQKALELRPVFAIARNNLGVVFGELGDKEQEIACYRAALHDQPLYPNASYNLGKALTEREDLTGALEVYDRILRYGSPHESILVQRGVVLGRLARESEALAQFQAAIAVAPRFAPAHYNLGLVFQKHDRLAEAVSSYQKAIALDPQYAEPLNNLAYLFATSPNESMRDGKEAVRLGARAVAVTGAKDASKLDTLACAYAENADFEKAEKCAQLALDVAGASGDRSLSDEIKQHLDLFKKKTPYREIVR